MPDIRQRGTDTSGRPLLASAYMWDWWDAVAADLGFEPTIVQGAWMSRAGGGAAASAGYHDYGGCFDLRVWDLTDAQVQDTIRATRRHGAGSWVRDHRHGMDPHIHLVLGSDDPLHDGAAWQWVQYLNGRDGLSSNGRDYHWRPDPLVTTPPEGDDMTPEDREWLDRRFDRLDKRLAADAAIRNRLKAAVQLLRDIEAAIGDDATRGQVRRVRADIAELSDDAAEESERPDGA